jgi:AraC-like DNA-binding protein
MSGSRPVRTFDYLHVWEIADDTLPLSALRSEAELALRVLLPRHGVRPTARPRFTVAGNRLVCEVPVLRVDGDQPATGVDRDAVLRLLGVGWSDRQVARELGCSPTTVGRIRREADGQAVAA